MGRRQNTPGRQHPQARDRAGHRLVEARVAGAWEDRHGQAHGESETPLSPRPQNAADAAATKSPAGLCASQLDQSKPRPVGTRRARGQRRSLRDRAAGGDSGEAARVVVVTVERSPGRATERAMQRREPLTSSGGARCAGCGTSRVAPRQGAVEKGRWVPDEARPTASPVGEGFRETSAATSVQLCCGSCSLQLQRRGAQHSPLADIERHPGRSARLVEAVGLEGGVVLWEGSPSVKVVLGCSRLEGARGARKRRCVMVWLWRESAAHGATQR